MIIDINGIQLYYEEFGSGNNYLIHAQQFANSYLYYTKDLADRGFHVFNIRIRGYRPSEAVAEDYGKKWYDIWAEDVLNFADALGIQTFFYTGFSHGAGIGWHLCRKAPDRIRGFFAIAGGPHKKDGRVTGSARMLTIEACETPEKWKKYAEEKAYQTGRVYQMLFDDAEAGVSARAAWDQNRQFWLNMQADEALINPQKPFPEVQSEEELISVLKTISIPALLIGGVLDKVSPPEVMVRTASSVQNAKMVLYSGDYTQHADIAHAYRKEIVEDILSFCRQRKLI